jgi:hypothetical protein
MASQLELMLLMLLVDQVTSQDCMADPRAMATPGPRSASYS